MHSTHQVPLTGAPATSRAPIPPATPWRPVVLGLLAVAMFAMTIPMTRVATGSPEAPQLPPLLVALGRGALAALPAALYLGWVRSRRPSRAEWPWLMGVVLGGVMVFPACMGWAVRQVPAWHASVITGVLPLLTAVLASGWLGQRPSPGFWWFGGLGMALVLGFALSTSSSLAVGWSGWPDVSLLIGMVGAAVAYVSGARAAQRRPAPEVMSWALVLALPVTAPGLWWQWSLTTTGWAATVQPQAWWALAYVALCSSWLGFFAWYAALAQDAMRVSQLQLLQPFGAMALSAWLLGEHVSAWAPLCAVGVAWCVWRGQAHLRRGAPSAR